VKKYLLSATSLCALVLVYLFQRESFAGLINMILPATWQMVNPNLIFAVNKTSRLVLNDLACIVLIYAVFRKPVYLRAAFYLFLIELLVLLPVYLVLKLSLEGDSEISSPLLSQIHRLIVNPLLMFLLMAGFIFQRLQIKKE
jgi:exosortase F-associated protein